MIDIDRDKGKALTWLLDVLRKSTDIGLPLYVGDDLTDEDAFEVVKREGGLALVVCSDEDRQTHADYALRDVAEVKKLLELLVLSIRGRSSN